MDKALHHLIILPIILPMAVGGFLLFFDERNRKLKSAVSLATASILVVVSFLLVVRAVEIAPAADVYQIGNWKAPFGIVLVLDGLSALMLVLSSFLTVASLLFAQAHWHKRGQNFHSQMQFILAGVNGAFLTGDLFNLFVFFEMLLTASYALAFHSPTPLRVRAGLHYVVVNLIASSLFLIGAALIYGVTGTLNIAGIAEGLKALQHHDVVMFEIGAGFLGLAFLVKAAMWPLNFWLTPLYSIVPAPIGAMFAILSKVGIYVILRFTLLIFRLPDSPLFLYGQNVIFYGGLATLVFGFLGVLASQALGRLVSYCVLISSGTLLAAVGSGHPSLTAGALYYFITSLLALSAFFLLVELLERTQDTAANVLAVTMEAYGDEDDVEQSEAGTYLPATSAILGACFALCAILLVGMPPLSGFIGKFMLINGLLNPMSLTGPLASHVLPNFDDWAFIVLLILSGLATLVALSRTGIRTFWASIEGKAPQVRVIEFAPIAGLLVLCVALTIFAGPVTRYLVQTSQELHYPENYIGSVLHNVSRVALP